ncbi:Arylsulfatase precursor [Planctomycetes bacterium K23_9]|uniref:Arylsulfatase n=2 Tax=Stieleria marina TaxID=1930275 RepID=A0A517NX91_9BACT|nr:Arylsulfatase precursor [Planctomycetes bacterium K23_9]
MSRFSATNFGKARPFAPLHIAAAILVSICVGSNSALATERPNIVIILVDDMGYGDPGCFNPESKIATPNIDSLAAAGMKFTDAHAPGPLCHMSRYGLMTGRYPFRTNCGRWNKEPVIDAGQMTIASLLKSQGYRTSMVGKWHLGFDESGGYEKPLTGGPVDRGFDSFFGIRASTDIPPYFYIRNRKAVAPPTDAIEANSTQGWSPIQGEFWRAGGIAPDLQLADVLPRFTDEAINVINQHHKQPTGEPLMMYLAYPAPHTPWLPSEPFNGKSGAGMYGDFLMMVDSMIGRVLKAMDETGMRDNTLVLFSSDNGPVWYENDVQRLGHDSSGGLRGMKADAWECGHRMPMIASWPGKVKANTTTDQMVCFTDFLATFADMTGADLALDDGPDSFSFWPVLTGQQPEDAPIRQHMVIRSGGPLMTIRQGAWKLIDGLGSSGFSHPKRIKAGPSDPAGQLYNLANDLGETKNVYHDHPDLVRQLQQKLSEIRDNGRSR